MNAVVGALNQQLGKDHAPLGVHRAVGDPVLLSQSAGCVDDKLLSNLVIHCCSLHFHRIVACKMHMHLARSQKSCQSQTAGVCSLF